jgi:hypothetical protein
MAIGVLAGKCERNMIYLREKASHGREPGCVFEATARSKVTWTFSYTEVNYT